jgi:hypothetical protein
MNEAVLFTIGATLARLFFIRFEGFTFRYWGDFEFFVFLTCIQFLFLRLPLGGLVKLYVIAFAIRELVRALSLTKMKDIPEYKKPKDVVITFKRCSTCSSVYDITQLVAFVLFSYFVVAYKLKIIRLLSR